MFKRKEEKHITDKDVMRTLPHTRREVFFDLFKHRKMSLFALSCFTFMFFIPLAVDLIFFNFLQNVAIASDKTDYLFSLFFYEMIILIPCMVIGCLGLAGAFEVAKNMVWQEGTMLASDFFHGIKTTWLHALTNGLILGVILSAGVIGSCFLLIYQPVSPIIIGVGIGAMILFFLFFGIAVVMNYTQDAYYQNSYGAVLKNSFRFMGLLNWRLLVIFLLSTGVVVTLCFFNIVTLIIGMALFAVLNSVVVILYTLVSHSAFDKYINMDNYPHLVGRGLYKVEDNDEINKDEEA